MITKEYRLLIYIYIYIYIYILEGTNIYLLVGLVNRFISYLL